MFRNQIYKPPTFFPPRPRMVAPFPIVAPPAPVPVSSAERTFCYDSGINSMLPLLVLHAQDEDTTYNFDPVQLNHIFGTPSSTTPTPVYPEDGDSASDGSKANLFWLMLARSQDSQDCDGQTNSGMLSVMLRKLLLDNLTWGRTGDSYPVGFGDEANFDLLDYSDKDDLEDAFSVPPTFDPEE